MGSSTTTQTQQSRAGAQSPEAARMMRLLGEAAGRAADDPALSGDFSLTASQRGLISEAQAAAGGVARSQMEQNLEAVLRQLEDTAIGRTITGGSLEAVNQALLGQDQLRSLDQLAMQQAGQAAEMGVNVPFQAAEATNKALLARLVQPAATGLNYDAVIRQLNSSMSGETKEPFDWGGTAMMGAKIGAAPFTGGASLGVPT